MNHVTCTTIRRLISMSAALAPNAVYSATVRPIDPFQDAVENLDELLSHPIYQERLALLNAQHPDDLRCILGLYRLGTNARLDEEDLIQEFGDIDDVHLWGIANGKMGSYHRYAHAGLQELKKRGETLADYVACMDRLLAGSTDEPTSDAAG